MAFVIIAQTSSMPLYYLAILPSMAIPSTGSLHLLLTLDPRLSDGIHIATRDISAMPVSITSLRKPPKRVLMPTGIRDRCCIVFLSTLQ